MDNRADDSVVIASEGGLRRAACRVMHVVHPAEPEVVDSGQAVVQHEDLHRGKAAACDKNERGAA